MIREIPNPNSQSDCAGVGHKINEIISKVNELEKRIEVLEKIDKERN